MTHSISLHSERPLINYSHNNDSSEEATRTLLLETKYFPLAALSFSPLQSLERTSYSSLFFLSPLPLVCLSCEEQGHLTLAFSLPRQSLRTSQTKGRSPSFSTDAPHIP